jgi:hypothetical protein
MKKQKLKMIKTRSDRTSHFFIRKNNEGNPSKPGSFFIGSFDFLNLLPIIETERFYGKSLNFVNV